MFNDVVVTLVQLIESSESSASVSIFIIILEAPAQSVVSPTAVSQTSPVSSQTSLVSSQTCRSQFANVINIHMCRSQFSF